MRRSSRAAQNLLGICVALSLLFPKTATAQAQQVGTHSTQSEFENARVLRAAGDYKTAIAILRSILRNRPRDIIVREELGYALILDGQMAAAQYQFEILKDRSTSADARALYTAVLRRIVAERPVSLSLIFGISPTSNLNQGTDNTTMSGGILGEGQIAPESRRISGWAGRIGLRGYVRGNLGATGNLTFDWRAERFVYSDFYKPQTETELGLAASTTTAVGDFVARVFRTDRIRAEGDYYRAGITFFGGRNLKQGRRLDGAVEFSHFRTENNPGNNSQRTLVNAGYSFTPNPALALRFGVQVIHNDAKRRALGYNSIAVTAQAKTALKGGTEMSIYLLSGHRRFNTDLGFARKDNVTDISLTVFNSRYSLRGIVPKLTCTIAINASNLALFDTKQQTCGLSLSRRF